MTDYLTLGIEYQAIAIAGLPNAETLIEKYLGVQLPLSQAFWTVLEYFRTVSVKVAFADSIFVDAQILGYKPGGVQSVWGKLVRCGVCVCVSLGLFVRLHRSSFCHCFGG